VINTVSFAFKNIPMKNIFFKNYFLLLLFILFSCSSPDPSKPVVTPTPPVIPIPPVTSLSWTNDSHLKTLYATVKMQNGVEVGTVGIYADYPLFHVVSAQGEGFTCVDDVSKAALFYLNETDIVTNKEKQSRLLKLTEFVLQMQADNGYFYNFLQNDFFINKTYRTSIASPGWWSWRALWHLSEAYTFYKTIDTVLAGRIQTSIQKIVANIKRDFGSLPNETTIVNGVTVPKWLPANSGTDQAAVMMLGLYNVYKQNQDAEVLAIIHKLANGMLLMQQGNDASFPYSAFMSYENTWHAYGSDQAYALLKVGKALNMQNWIEAAQKEVDNFYPFLLREGFLESFEIQQTGSSISLIKKSSFAQISYGIRPMIWASIELYKINYDAKYLTQAAQILSWYLGNNPAKLKMYDKSTGICYDGISSSTNVNKNSGAESTIEALLSFQMAEKYPDVLVEVKKYN
jgi:hypothetical protein